MKFVEFTTQIQLDEQCSNIICINPLLVQWVWPTSKGCTIVFHADDNYAEVEGSLNEVIAKLETAHDATSIF